MKKADIIRYVIIFLIIAGGSRLIMGAGQLYSTLNLPWWAPMLAVLGTATIIIIDYYWLGGKLNRGRHYYGKK
ncbi:hypothetical protein HY312_00965 [Candidatus Saccharibacteria bacterium]|nr:hypothetical protein [Candidatus Saccharibacteria bacterium]